ncbi:MAG TPA: response regulator [Thermoanaerobaculia bacterium]|nr:response regulator [Thermoanaerobaculia bacterium]
MEDIRPVVLILDDDVSIRRSMGRLLRSVGLEMQGFPNAGELLRYERPLRPTCLVLDIYLPDMNGLDLLKRLTVTDPELPVVVITGHVDESLRQRALRAGATAFLAKPYDEQVLLEAIQGALLRPVRRPVRRH